MNLFHRVTFYSHCWRAGIVGLTLAAGTAMGWVGEGGPDDWPQWRGPNRDDISAETGLLDEWPEAGPQLLWRFDNGGVGYAGFAVVDDRLYTMGANESREFVLCLDASNGKEIWKREIDDRYQNNWGDGPRGTPTVANGHVVALAARGTLACLDAKTGQVVWTQSMTDLGGSVPGWGYCESPLVDGDQVVCTPGGPEGALVAIDMESGEVRWQSTLFTEPAQYSSIIVADHPEKRHYVQLTEKALVGVDPADGTVLWREVWNGRTAVIPTPIYHDQGVYVTSGYGSGSALINISDIADPEQVWFSRNMKNHHGGVILVDGYFYGYSDQIGWVCQSHETGDIVWSEKDKAGKGAIGYADGHFYLVEEKSGDVILIDATPDGWNERGRFTLSPQSDNRKRSGGVWVHPVISGGRLFLRDQELIYCFDVKSPKRESP